MSEASRILVTDVEQIGKEADRWRSRIFRLAARSADHKGKSGEPYRKGDGEGHGVPEDSQEVWLHFDRATGRDRDYRHTGRDPLPGFCSGAREGAADRVLEQLQADGSGAGSLQAGL